MKRFALTLDLKDDNQLIAEYELHHKKIWSEIKDSILDSGIENMEIYRIGNRLFMIIEVTDSFSFEKKAEADKNNPTVQAWEQLMSQYQKTLPMAKHGEKWLLMNKIFSLD